MVCRSQEAFHKSAVGDHKNSHRAEGVGSRPVERENDRPERDHRLEVASGYRWYSEREEDDTRDAPMGPLRAFSLCLVGPSNKITNQTLDA